MNMQVSSCKNNALAKIFNADNISAIILIPNRKIFSAADQVLYRRNSNFLNFQDLNFGNTRSKFKMASAVDKNCSQIDAEMACLFCREAKKTSRLKFRASKREKYNARYLPIYITKKSWHCNIPSM